MLHGERMVQTTAEANTRLVRQKTLRNLLRYRNAPRAEMARRLDELGREWDVERAFRVDATLALLGGLALGIGVHRRFFLVSALAGGFLLQHAWQGSSLPARLLRRAGYRTQPEIEAERRALARIMAAAR